MSYDFDPSVSWDLHCMAEDMRVERTYAAYGIPRDAVCHGTCRYCHAVVASGDEVLYEDGLYVCSYFGKLVDGYDEAQFEECLMDGCASPMVEQAEPFELEPDDYI